MEISADAPAGPAEDRTLSEMIEFLKTEHAQCLERNELWDANSVQNLILSFLDEVKLSTKHDQQMPREDCRSFWRNEG